ncbi:hypothetical protein OSB04_018415 [Centaurea solstitialis]|uniref:Uncharacterized protein n=1 Tax=Centaurea solstitialis TaxID=347529 RepID=A0AA38T4S2_9ASTR|nr:hypothetical protein OSB04_018415 [Centaurea solstitialis]
MKLVWTSPVTRGGDRGLGGGVIYHLKPSEPYPIRHVADSVLLFCIVEFLGKTAGISVFLMPAGMLGMLVSLVDVLPLFSNTNWGQNANVAFLRDDCNPQKALLAAVTSRYSCQVEQHRSMGICSEHVAKAIRDAYMLKIFENNETRLPSWCNDGGDRLPTARLSVSTALELPLYNTLEPYANMNENYPSLPPLYDISIAKKVIVCV